MLSRRSLFGGLLASLAAPAIIRTPGLLMPVKRGLAGSWEMDGYVVDGGIATSITINDAGPWFTGSIDGPTFEMDIVPSSVSGILAVGQIVTYGGREFRINGVHPT